MKGSKWYLSALADLRTQFDKGIRILMIKITFLSFCPAYSNIALGMDYKPSSNFSLFMSPITGR